MVYLSVEYKSCWNHRSSTCCFAPKLHCAMASSATISLPHGRHSSGVYTSCDTPHDSPHDTPYGVLSNGGAPCWLVSLVCGDGHATSLYLLKLFLFYCHKKAIIL